MGLWLDNDMSTTHSTCQEHAARIAELTGSTEDFIFSFPGNGDLKIETMTGETIYRINDAHANGITPEALAPFIWA